MRQQTGTMKSALLLDKKLLIFSPVIVAVIKPLSFLFWLSIYFELVVSQMERIPYLLFHTTVSTVWYIKEKIHPWIMMNSMQNSVGSVSCWPANLSSAAGHAVRRQSSGSSLKSRRQVTVWRKRLCRTLVTAHCEGGEVWRQVCGHSWILGFHTS